jgi:hypothetical protein
MVKKASSRGRNLLGAAEQLALLRKLRQQVAAQLIGIEPRTLREKTAPRNVDGTYDGTQLVAWFLEHDRRKRESIDGDPLLGGGDTEGSVWLEEYRHQKALEAKRKNEIEEGKLVDADTLTYVFDELGRALRVDLEGFESRHGAEVGQAVREMIGRAEDLWRKRIALARKGREREEAESAPPAPAAKGKTPA